MHRTSPARTARWRSTLCRRPTALVCVLVLGRAPEVAAGSLAGRLHQFIDQNGFPTSHDFVEVVTPIVQRLALRGIDFPVTATTPSFSYRFNFDLGMPERTPESLGPAFAERANTVGRHRFDLGVAYLYANLTRFDGTDFGKQILTAGVRTDPATGFQAGGAFRGIGDPTVTPALIVSRAIRSHDVHASAGVEMNADDLQRTRARYAAGVTLQPWTRLACLLDLIGSSSFVDDEFTIPRPLHRSDQLFGNDELIESVGPTTVVARVPRSDVLDLAV